MQPSLRKKITYGYILVALLILTLSLLTYAELRLVEAKLHLGERVAALLDTTLEIRRFERNYFLHQQWPDYQENQGSIQQLRGLLVKDRADLDSLGLLGQAAGLADDLDRYSDLMQRYAQDTANRIPASEARETPIRVVGKRLVVSATEMVNHERQLVGHSLAKFRNLLMLAIVVVIALVISLGQVLSQRIVKPLKIMEQNVAAVLHGNRDHLSLPSRDREIVSITDTFNHMLRELELRQKHLLRSEKLAALGTMLSGVAHELNNPLSNIWSSCQIMLEELEVLEIGYQRELLKQIDEQSQRARDIVRSLLDFARDRQFKTERVLLQPLMAQTVRFIRSEIPSGITLTLDIPADIEIDADKQRLQQVFLNLLKNALQAVNLGGQVVVSANRLTSTSSIPNAVLADCTVSFPAIDIVIKDNGHGIDPEILPRIFDPFFTTKDVGKGMGLGLFIVYEIIEQHAGCIAVSSELGKGTAFHVCLPEARAS
ncbi:MAG: HAMP domain-containing histidine kinase [Gammaproteobacteria bacterium]|nr:HAMP domain-containing histidine kinase [Gammaproteobacteria bacterium]